MSGRIARAAAALLPALVLFLGCFASTLAGSDAFTLNDFSIQHLPWAWTLYDCLREGTLPYWTTAIGGGFPLAAEGQIGAWYPLHRIAYTALPFWTAYALLPPLHFAIGIAGMYAYSRQRGAEPMGAGIAATVFAFGSGYAGCFYNTGSLKVLCWLPAALWLSGHAASGSAARRAACWTGVALIVYLQWTAGFSQFAVYGFLYLLLHALLTAIPRDAHGGPSLTTRALRVVLPAVLAVGCGTLMASEQLLSSLQLISLSVRQGESPAFALWGSVPPVAPVTLLFPQWGNALRYSFYIGAVPLLLAMWAIARRPWPNEVRIQTALAAIFFAAALGGYNPLYRWAVEGAGLTMLRNPSKFLFFVTLPLAMLAAWGWERLRREGDGAGRARGGIRRLAIATAALTALLPAAALAALWALEALYPSFRADYVARLVAEKGALAKDPEYYRNILDGILSAMSGFFSYKNGMNLQQIAVTAAGGYALVRAASSRSRWAVVLVQIALIWDLGVYARYEGTGFLGNVGRIDAAPTPRSLQVQALVDVGKRPSVEFARDPKSEKLPPNLNMLVGLTHPGGYSPLLIKRHHELVGDLGWTDSSLGRAPADVSVWARKKGIIDLCGVEWIRSDTPLGLPGLRLIDDTDGLVYRNDNALPDLTLHTNWTVESDKGRRLASLTSASFDPRGKLLIEGRPDARPAADGVRALDLGYVRWMTPQTAEARVRVDREGLVLWRNTHYPGWSVTVDGESAELFAADHVFTAFAIQPGEHILRMRYSPAAPTAARGAWAIWTLILALSAAGAVRTHFRSNSSTSRI